MAGFFGADTDQLRDFADQLQAGRSRIEDIAGRMTAQALTVEWEGADADAFRTEAFGPVQSLFDNAGGLLQGRHTEAHRHAEEQDQASAQQDGDPLGPLGDAVGDVVGDIIDGLAGLGESAWNFLTDTTVQIASGIAGVALDIVEGIRNGVGKLGSWAKTLGKVFAPIGILGGVDSILNSDRDGWRKVGDMIAGGLGVAAGVGAFIPGVGWAATAVLGGASALWTIGNEIADNWDGITENVKEFGSDALDWMEETGGDVVDTFGDAAEGFGNWVSGLI